MQIHQLFSNFIPRVYYIGAKFNSGGDSTFDGFLNSMGTGCFIKYNGAHYIVTAKHVVGQKNPGTVYISANNQWRGYKILGFAAADSDICALHVDSDASIGCDKSMMSIDNIHLGQELYYFGFPGITGNLELKKINGCLPFPVMKRSMLSYLSDKRDIFLIDGMIEPGSSGSPVVFIDVHDKNKLKIAGIISSSLSTHVYNANNGKLSPNREIVIPSGLGVVEPINKISALLDSF